VRVWVWLVVGLALGVTLWLLVRGATPEREPLVGDAPPTVAEEDPAWARLRSGSLELHVRTPTGQVPTGAQVGFETARGTKLYYVDEDGKRTLADVPLGDVIVIAKAPDYETLRRPTRVEPGVPGELRLVLEPSR
jgi:hypothetical protein